MISVQKVRVRPGKGKGKSDGWFPQPLTHNTRRVCTDDPENKLPMHSVCPTREWEREWYGVTTPNIISGQGVILFSFGATPPLIGEAEEVVSAEPLGAFNRDPNDLVLTVGGKLVVNHLLERRGLYGGVARVAPEVEGVAQVVEWRQVGEYAAVTDFVWLRRLGLVLDDAKKEGQGMCPCHQV